MPYLSIMLGHPNFKYQYLPGWPNTAGIGYSNIKAVHKIYVVSSKDYQATKSRSYINATTASKEKVILLEKVEAFSVFSGDDIHTLLPSFQNLSRPCKSCLFDCWNPVVDKHFPSKLSCPYYLFSILLSDPQILSSEKHLRICYQHVSLKNYQ